MSFHDLDDPAQLHRLSYCQPNQSSDFAFQVEAGRLAAVSKQLKALKAEQFKRGQQLFSLKAQEQEVTSDINGSSAQNRNLGHKLRKLDEKVSCCLSESTF